MTIRVGRSLDTVVRMAGVAIVAVVTDSSSLRRRITQLEERLGGAEQPRPWPAGWRQESDAAQPPRIGILAFKLGGESIPRDSLAAERLFPEGAFAHRSAERFPAASTMKVYVLQALFEAVVAGDMDLGDSRELAVSDRVTGSGVLKLLNRGSRFTLLDLATLMICVSDNSATNMLIDVLSIERIRASVEANGWTDTSLSGKLQQAPVASATKRSPSVTSPRDLADYFGRLWSGELLPPGLTEVATGIYRKQQFGELGRAIGYDHYSAEIGTSDLVIGSKSGSIRGVRNDAGVVEYQSEGATERTVVAVMTDGCADLRFHAENLGAQVVGDVAAAVIEHLGGARPGS